MHDGGGESFLARFDDSRVTVVASSMYTRIAAKQETMAPATKRCHIFPSLDAARAFVLAAAQYTARIDLATPPFLPILKFGHLSLFVVPFHQIENPIGPIGRTGSSKK
jgi:hypothetical protein